MAEGPVVHHYVNHQIHRRSGKPCPRCGALIEFFRQAGRITYACPKCQR